jgi:hypothetical protein
MQDQNTTSSDVTTMPAPPPDLADVAPNSTDSVVPGDPGTPPADVSGDAPADATGTTSSTDSGTASAAPEDPPAPADFTVGQPVAFDYVDGEGNTITQSGAVISIDDVGHVDVGWYTGVATLLGSQLRAL